jgi:hypothetical protein
MNHIHYQDRLDFVRHLLQDRFAVEVPIESHLRDLPDTHLHRF